MGQSDADELFVVGKKPLKIKNAPFQSVFYAVSICFYEGLGAPTGQTSAQAPHSMQVSASIMYWLSPWEIALTGHSASHAPQLMHSSLIT
jgi:hypothetical protein